MYTLICVEQVIIYLVNFTCFAIVNLNCVCCYMITYCYVDRRMINNLYQSGTTVEGITVN